MGWDDLNNMTLIFINMANIISIIKNIGMETEVKYYMIRQICHIVVNELSNIDEETVLVIIVLP